MDTSTNRRHDMYQSQYYGINVRSGSLDADIIELCKHIDILVSTDHYVLTDIEGLSRTKVQEEYRTVCPITNGEATTVSHDTFIRLCEYHRCKSTRHNDVCMLCDKTPSEVTLS